MVRGLMSCKAPELELEQGEQGAAPEPRALDLAGPPIKASYVSPAGFAKDADLRAWIAEVVELTKSISPRED